MYSAVLLNRPSIAARLENTTKFGYSLGSVPFQTSDQLSLQISPQLRPYVYPRIRCLDGNGLEYTPLTKLVFIAVLPDI